MMSFKILPRLSEQTHRQNFENIISPPEDQGLREDIKGCEKDYNLKKQLMPKPMEYNLPLTVPVE